MRFFPEMLYVALGGAVGSAFRYYLSQQVLSTFVINFFPSSFFNLFPHSTVAILGVNLLGCLLAGLFLGVFRSVVDLPQALSLILMTGFLGGFTTFSAFELDIFQLLEQGQVLQVLVYVGLSVFGGLLLFALGAWVPKLLLAP